MQKTEEKESKFDEIDYHEALDRTHLVLDFFTDHVSEHPVIEKHFKEEADKIGDALAGLYQKIGVLRFKEG